MSNATVKLGFTVYGAQARTEANDVVYGAQRRGLLKKITVNPRFIGTTYALVLRGAQEDLYTYLTDVEDTIGFDLEDLRAALA